MYVSSPYDKLEEFVASAYHLHLNIVLIHIVMKSSIRCCIACILPCGALDVIRIVHSNGRVEEITGTVRAAEIMKAHPKHILKKATTRPHISSSYSDDEDQSSSSAAATSSVPRIVVVPPDAELQRGKIYFLIPVSSSSSNASTEKLRQKKCPTPAGNAAAGATRKRREQGKKKSTDRAGFENSTTGVRSSGNCCRNYKVRVCEDHDQLLVASSSSDRYLSEILSEKISTQRERRRGRVAVWRPGLESICESACSEAASDDYL